MAETRRKSAERDHARGVNDGRSGMEKEISRALRPFQKKLAAEAALRAVCVSGLFALPVWLALALARRCFGGAVGRPEALMLPVESVFIPLPLLVVEPWVEQHLYNGCPTSRYPAADGRYRVRNAAGQFLGLANITGGVLRVEKLFVERN